MRSAKRIVIDLAQVHPSSVLQCLTKELYKRESVSRKDTKITPVRRASPKSSTEYQIDPKEQFLWTLEELCPQNMDLTTLYRSYFSFILLTEVSLFFFTKSFSLLFFMDLLSFSLFKNVPIPFCLS